VRPRHEHVRSGLLYMSNEISSPPSNIESIISKISSTDNSHLYSTAYGGSLIFVFAKQVPICSLRRCLQTALARGYEMEARYSSLSLADSRVHSIFVKYASPCGRSRAEGSFAGFYRLPSRQLIRFVYMCLQPQLR